MALLSVVWSSVRTQQQTNSALGWLAKPGTARRRVVPNQGYVHGLKGRSAWKQQYSQFLSTSKKKHVEQFLRQEEGKGGAVSI